MSTNANEQLIRETIDQIFNQGNPSAAFADLTVRVDGLLADDDRGTGPAQRHCIQEDFALAVDYPSSRRAQVIVRNDR